MLILPDMFHRQKSENKNNIYNKKYFHNKNK